MRAPFPTAFALGWSSADTRTSRWRRSVSTRPFPGRGVGSPIWAQAPGPQWGEKEPRELLLFTRDFTEASPEARWTLTIRSCAVRPPPYILQRICAVHRLAWRWKTQSARRDFWGPAHALTGTICLALRGGLNCCFFLLRDRHRQGPSLEPLRMAALGPPWR